MADGDLAKRILHDSAVGAENWIDIHLFGSLIRQRFEVVSVGEGSIAINNQDILDAFSQGPIDEGQLNQIRVHISNGHYSPQHAIDVSMLALNEVDGYETPAKIAQRLGIV